MVRHGKAAANWTTDLDPGLGPEGQQQAVAAEEELRGLITDLSTVALATSPLRRTQETSVPTAQAWEKKVAVEPRVAEIPSPSLSMDERGPWLQAVMADRWSNLSAELQDWRQGVIDCIKETSTPTVFFSHFIAINVLTGWLTGDDRVVNFFPENCSITQLRRSDDGEIQLVKKGEEGITRVN